MDYKSCFDSIYTHAYKWIVERNVIDSKNADNSNLFISIDRILQNINGRSSNGLVVGPEFSRMIAEMLLQQIDSEVLFVLSNNGIEYDRDYTIYRYVDDIIVFSNAQETLDVIIGKYNLISEKYLLHLNELKLVVGETPCIPKGWLGETRRLSDVLDNIFTSIKKADYDELPDEERFIVKSDYIPVDRIKSEITVVMKEYQNDRRTVVSFLLSTLLNNISKRKDGYTLFGNNKINKAMLLVDMAFFIYAFCPSFDQTRKLISMIVYLDDEIDFKSDDSAMKKLRDVINRYSFIFQRGNIFDLCDWFPFLSEYGISLSVNVENSLVVRATDANDPIIWANILLYSRYYVPFMETIKAKLNEIIEGQISKISGNEILLHREFWYIMIFHNCPDISPSLQAKMSNIVNDLLNLAIPNISKYPSSMAIKLVCDYLQRQSSSGNKPLESFFNWNNIRGISAQIAYRTYQRTIFKHYRRNKYSLYTSLN
jgi:hypothetical protein